VSASLRLGFAGTPAFAASHLAAIAERTAHELVGVWSQPDRPAGRGKHNQPSPVSLLAGQLNVPLFRPARLDSCAIEEMAALRLDLLVVVAYGLILPQPALETPRLGCINVHASLLPRWRGAAPIQRAIEAGDRETGVCIMQMDAGLDTGPVLAKAAVEIGARETAGSLHDKLIAIGCDTLLSSLDQIADGAVNAMPQGAEGVTYAAKITKGESAIYWSRPACEIDRLIRAFNPAPGAYSWLANQRIRFLQALPTDLSMPGGVPGSLVLVDGSTHAICCGEGMLIPEVIQLPGKRPMTVPEILRGHPHLLPQGRAFTHVATA